MDSKLQSAKHAFLSKDYHKAKQLLLKMIASNEYVDNYQYCNKLGDVFMKLEEYKNAARFYKQALQKNTSNPQLFIKLANVLSDHLDKPQEADETLEQCHTLHPNNDQSLFIHAKLMENKDFNKSFKLYIDCLAINDDRASVHFHLAELLIQSSDNKHSTDIGYHLKRAISIQPTVALYHYQYAVHSQKMHKFNRANYHYQRALDLVNYDDGDMVRDYFHFLIHCVNDKHKAMECLQMAGFQKDYQFSMDEAKYEEEGQIVKLVIYDFSVVSYWPLEISMDELQNMGQMDLIRIFGQKGRLWKFQRHFTNVLESQQKPIIVLLSPLSRGITRDALARVKLIEYFNDIISIDAKSKSRIHQIIDIKDDYNIFQSDQVLYVTQEHADDLFSQCSVYGVDDSLSHPLKGITPGNLDEIECIATNTEYHPDKTCDYADGYSLSQKDRGLYERMTEEIRGNVGFHRVPIDLVPSMKECVDENKDDWITFGYKYCQMRNRYGMQRWWEAAHILRLILKLEWNTPNLLKKYGTCMSYLGHDKEAEVAFKKALKLNPRHYKSLYDYGYHLFLLGRFVDAEKLFHDALGVCRYHQENTRGVYIMMAKTAEALNKLDEAEYFLKLSVGEDFDEKIEIRGKEECYKSYLNAHYQYGRFCAKYGRYKDARREFEICVKHRPKTAVYHYKYADVLWNLGDRQGFKYHLAKTLEIDPWNAKAKNDERNDAMITPLEYPTPTNGNDYRHTHQSQRNNPNHNGSKVSVNTVTSDIVVNCTPI